MGHGLLLMILRARCITIKFHKTIREIADLFTENFSFQTSGDRNL